MKPGPLVPSSRAPPCEGVRDGSDGEVRGKGMGEKRGQREENNAGEEGEGREVRGGRKEGRKRREKGGKGEEGERREGREKDVGIIVRKGYK